MINRRDMRMILKCWGDTVSFCEDKQSELRKYEELYEGLVVTTRRMDITGDRRAIGQYSDPVAKAVLAYGETLREYADAVEGIKQSICDALQCKKSLDTYISYLPLMQQRILVNRYVQRLGWMQIEIQMERYNHTSDYLKQLEGKAVDTLRRRIPDNYAVL